MRFWTSNRASIGDYRVSWVLKIAPQRHDGRSVDTAPLRLEPMTSHEPSAICSRRGPIRVMGGLVEDRKWPMAAMLAMLIAGVGYMLLWNPWVHHVDSWNTGGDLWGIFRGAHYVGWGFIGGVYTPQNGIITFPGMPILMAPLAIVSGWLHLSESYGAFTLPRPTAALLIQPFELLLASTAVFACDNLARRLLVTSRRRIALCAVTASIAWPTAAIWGHAEDAVATALAVWALAAILDGRWKRAGWLLGAGILVQPLVALLVPLLIGATPRGQRWMVALRSAVLSVLLVGVAFVGDPGDTFRALVKQPTQPAINHATPWLALAPSLPSAPAHAGGPPSYPAWATRCSRTSPSPVGPQRS